MFLSSLKKLVRFNLISAIFCLVILSACSGTSPADKDIIKTQEDTKNTIVGSNSSKKDLRYPDYKKAIISPINGTLPKGECSYLIVQIPENFQSIQENIMQPMVEFIPKGENPLNWSEIITTRFYKDKSPRLTAKAMVLGLKNEFTKDGPSTKILEENYEDFKTYSSATILMSYLWQGRREIVFARYFSGPYDCAGFQYSITLSDKITESEALKKIKDFVNENTIVSDKF